MMKAPQKFPTGDAKAKSLIVGTDYFANKLDDGEVIVGKLGVGGKADTDTRLHIKGTSENDIVRMDIGLDINPVVNPSAPTLTLLEEAGNVDAGLHYYRITYYTDLGETGVGSYSSVTTDATHGKVKITLPISDDYRVTGRRIYRSKADGPAYQVYLVADISDNTTTEYTDNIADADLGSTNAYYRENTTAKYITVNGEGVWMAGMGSEPNTIFGKGAGATIFDGTAVTGSNVLIGENAGRNLTTGKKNVAVGRIALYYLTSGGSNTSIGAESSQHLTTGSAIVAIGSGAGRYNEEGNYNTLVGHYAGYSSSGNSYSYDTLIGKSAMQYITTGNYDTALGYYAGTYIADGSTENKTTTKSVYLGAKTKALADGDTNEIVIGYDTTGFGSNTAAYGNSSITKHIFQAGNIGIGVTDFGTNAQKVIGIGLGQAPESSPADMVQVWGADLNGAGTCGLKMRDELGTNWTVMGVSDTTAVSTGTGTILMGSANNADNAGWLHVTAPDGTTVYIPYWSTATP